MDKLKHQHAQVVREKERLESADKRSLGHQQAQDIWEWTESTIQLLNQSALDSYHKMV